MECRWSRFALLLAALSSMSWKPLVRGWTSEAEQGPLKMAPQVAVWATCRPCRHVPSKRHHKRPKNSTRNGFILVIQRKIFTTYCRGNGLSLTRIGRRAGVRLVNLALDLFFFAFFRFHFIGFAIMVWFLLRLRLRRWCSWNVGRCIW